MNAAPVAGAGWELLLEGPVAGSTSNPLGVTIR